MATGIAQVWLKWEDILNQAQTVSFQIYKENKKDEGNGKSPSTVIMKSNIWTIFITYTFLAMLCFILFIIEFLLGFAKLLTLLYSLTHTLARTSWVYLQ